MPRFEGDAYVPLSVDFGGFFPGGPNYLRAINDTNLLEIGVSPDDGALCSVTLVHAEREIPGLHADGELFDGSAGIPVFDLSLWGSEKFVDSRQQFDVVGNERITLIRLSTVAITRRVRIGQGAMSFAFDGEDTLVGIAFRRDAFKQQ